MNAIKSVKSNVGNPLVLLSLKKAMFGEPKSAPPALPAPVDTTEGEEEFKAGERPVASPKQCSGVTGKGIQCARTKVTIDEEFYCHSHKSQQFAPVPLAVDTVRKQCEGTTTKGSQCLRMTSKSVEIDGDLYYYCHSHINAPAPATADVEKVSYQCAGTTSKGLPCTLTTTKSEKVDEDGLFYCHHHIGKKDLPASSKIEPVLCSGTTKKGLPCRLSTDRSDKIIDGVFLCHHHNRVPEAIAKIEPVVCSGTTKKGTPCSLTTTKSEKIKDGKFYCHHHTPRLLVL